MNEIIIKDSLIYFCKKEESLRNVRANFFGLFIAVVSVVVATVALAVGIATLVVTIYSYNHRYDSEAQASGGIKFAFEKNGKTRGSSSFTSTVGQIKYGYFQKQGSETEYTLYYKNPLVVIIFI